MRQKFIEQGRKLGLVGTALVVFVNNAMAAVPAAVTTSITDAGADASTVAGATLVILFSLLGFAYMRRQAK